LDGITVVSIEHAVAAPFATRQLADLGARVIKVERPGEGDFARSYDGSVRGLSAYFVWLNRSKESLSLDLKHPKAREIMARLIANTDVFVQNLLPGATDRMGLSAEKLRTLHPRLVVCDISGYGDTGPYREKKAYDFLVQAEGGLLSVTGSPEEPARCGISVVDISAGMYAYSGILSALYLRERTGLGKRVEISMLEALGEWMGQPLYYSHFHGTPPRRSGARHATLAPYGLFRTGGGGSLIFGVQSDREWKVFRDEVLRLPDLVGDPRFESNPQRVANWDALAEAITSVFSVLKKEEVIARLEASGIAYSEMREMEEVWDHPQFAARGRWREVGSPAGPLPALAPPANLEGIEARMDPIPALGEHTESILRELKYGDGDIARMKSEGVL
jgi:itaconate CoA-transferase